MASSKDIQENIAEIEALKASARRSKFRYTLFTVVFVVGCVLIIIWSAKTLAESGPRHEELMTELKRGVDQHVVPELRVQANRTVAALKPVLNEEMKHLEERSDEIAQSFFRELKLMEGNLAGQTDQIIAETFGAELESREVAIRRMHPTLTSAKLEFMVNEFYNHFERKVNDVAEVLFTPHMAALGGIVTHVETIKESEADASSEDVNMDLALLIMNIMNAEFSEIEPELTRTL
ncbi:MAG: hypothetical protein ACPGVU_04355 [Limisphaerales bacterium]